MRVNGQPWKAAIRAGEYLPVRRKWEAEDKILLTLEVKPRLTAANPRVAEADGKAALEFGPLVYAAEQADQQGIPSVFDAALTADPRPRARWRPDLLGGIVLIEHRGLVCEKPLTEEPLYQPLAAVAARAAGAPPRSGSFPTTPSPIAARPRCRSGCGASRIRDGGEFAPLRCSLPSNIRSGGAWRQRQPLAIPCV